MFSFVGDLKMPPRKNRSSTLVDTAKPRTSKTDTASKKRKSATSDDETVRVQPTKRSRTSKDPARANKVLRQTEISTKSTGELEKPIIINRAPVLELWAACVAHFLHPKLSWKLCLSIGSSISTITAISKGRSIGTVAPPHESKDDAPANKGKQAGDELPTPKVMGFPMTIKGESVMVKGKPKTTREVSLVRKYGSDETYRQAKDAMAEALEAWKGKEDDLDAKAFHMYV